MNIVRSCITIREIFFPMMSWGLIFIVYWAFSWFFNEPVDLYVYIIPIAFIFCVYLGFILNNNYITYEKIKLVKRINFLALSIIGFSTVILQLYLNRTNLNLDLATVRENHQEFSQVGIHDTLYSLLFPLLLISFILVNFNDLKYKKFINIIVLISCIAFIPINGGRVNFLVFGALYMSIKFYKEFHFIKQSLASSIFKFMGLFLLVSVLSSVFGVLRTGKDSEQIINYLSTLQHIDNNVLNSLSTLPYNMGFIIILFINTFYDYTGGNVYYLDIFLKEFHKIDYRTFGFYNFNFLDRFKIINWNKTHDDIDNLYLNHDIKYNVWATFVRDFSIDFGIFGTFIVLTILSFIMFNSRKYITRSYSAQALFFIIFAFLLFSPFHSLFFLTRAYGVAFCICIILFFRFKLIKSI